jgi:hypothetical protein
MTISHNLWHLMISGNPLEEKQRSFNQSSLLRSKKKLNCPLHINTKNCQVIKTKKSMMEGNEINRRQVQMINQIAT